MKNIYFREKAKQDLEDIWLYTLNKWSVEQANKYYSNIRKAIISIGENPDIGQSMEHIRKNYKSLKVQAHRIYYQFISDQIVEIVRILHQKMDINNWLIP